jgi:pimeloyl-ACP methyl ester carboxylesterase
VIVECGHSDFSNTWAAVQQCISPFARVCTYDRAGYGQSETSPTPRAAANIALELQSLLLAAEIEPPYVLVGHSCGGILIREFLALLDVETMVAGMVLVDAVQEKSDIEVPWPFPELIAVLGDLDRYTVIGLEDTQKLTAKEWEEAKALENDSYAIASDLESEAMASSELALAQKRQMEMQILGNTRLSVIKGNSARDIGRIYEAGVQAGNGTVEDRRVVKRLVDSLNDLDIKLQREQLNLSSDSRLVNASGSGHNVHLQQPEIVAQEVR